MGNGQQCVERRVPGGGLLAYLGVDQRPERGEREMMMKGKADRAGSRDDHTPPSRAQL